MGRVVVPQRKDSIGGAKAPPILSLSVPYPVAGRTGWQVGTAETCPHVCGCVCGTAGFAARRAAVRGVSLLAGQHYAAFFCRYPVPVGWRRKDGCAGKEVRSLRAVVAGNGIGVRLSSV